MASSHSPARTVLLNVLKFGVSGGLLWVLLRQTDTATLGAHLANMDIRWMVLALALYGCAVMISAWRWRLLLSTQGADAGIGQLAQSFLVATFFNNFLPSNIGGDVVRIADTAPLAGSRTTAASVVLIDRALGLLALIVVAATGAMVADINGFRIPGSNYAWVALLGAVTVTVPALATPQLLSRMLVPLKSLGSDWVDARLDRLHEIMARMKARRSALVMAFVGAFAVQFVLVIFHLAAAFGLGISLPLGYALVIVPTSLVVQMVPMSINGFGVREATFSYFFVKLGLGVGAALALSLTSTGLIMLFSVSGGLLFLMRRRAIDPLPTVR